MQKNHIGPHRPRSSMISHSSKYNAATSASFWGSGLYWFPYCTINQCWHDIYTLQDENGLIPMHEQKAFSNNNLHEATFSDIKSNLIYIKRDVVGAEYQGP